jgi:trimethylamine--corrinoid protein Co-methyltransferase
MAQVEQTKTEKEADPRVAHRSGGSRARRVARATHSGDKVVRPGLMGGAYRPLGDRDIQRIHETALKVLENIGMADPIPILRERALERGCWIDDGGRLHFPAALVEDVIAQVDRNAVFRGRDDRCDIDLKGTSVHYAPGAEAVNTIDFESGRYRPSTLVDLYDFARLVDSFEHVNVFSRVAVATELKDGFDIDFNIAYASLAGTNKHVELGFANGDNLERTLPLIHMIAGGEKKYLERPFCSAFGCPVVSPLTYGEDNSTTCVAGIQFNSPVNLIIGPQAGSTAPAALAGTLVQVVAEALAATLLINLVKPGHPIVFGLWASISDLRTAAFSGGGGEQALISAASGQIGAFYDLPTSVSAGVTDSKAADAQMGFEKCISTVLAALAGTNGVGHSCGMMASLLACSFESMVIDNEMLGVVQRALRGIEVTEETLSYEVIEDVVLRGPRHYLELMESEFLFPEISDRSAPDVWEEGGSLDIKDRAHTRAREILSTHYPEYIDPKIDTPIRERFPILLAKEDMRPECGRW